MIVPFKYWLHDDNETDGMIDTLEGQGIPSDIAAKIADERPFYEIEIEAEYNTEDGSISYTKVRST